MLASNSFLFQLPSSSSDQQFSSPENGFIIKRKRRPAGTPDPDAQVVYLTAEMLMESDRYVCEICNLSFQREQNLQMHRRRHKVPWKLKKKNDQEENNNNNNNFENNMKKRVYVCPEPSCVHHDPCHALGDLVGIKKHFRRKHSNYKQWVCEKCCKGYAVQSDYKAHIKTCGTRGHSCDCGRVFSRVETFIEHQDSCKAKNNTTKSCHDVHKPNQPNFLPQNTTFNPPQNFSNYSNFNSFEIEPQYPHQNYSRIIPKNNIIDHPHHHPSLELELFTSPTNYNQSNLHNRSLVNHAAVNFGQSGHNYQENEGKNLMEESTIKVLKLKSEAKEIMRIAMEQKAKAAEKRQEAKCLIELANLEMAKASEIKKQLYLSEYNYSSTIMKNNNNNHVMPCCSSCNKLFQTVSSAFYKR